MPNSSPLSSAETPRRASRWRRWCLRGGLLAVVLGASAWGLRAQWLEPLLARSVVEALEQHLGGRWQVEHVSGSLIGSVQIVGLVCSEAPKNGALRHCTIAETTVDYRLWHLFGGQPLTAISALTVTGARIEIDATASPGSREPSPVTLPALPLAAQVAIAGDVTVATSVGVVHVGDLRVSGQLANPLLDGAVTVAEHTVGDLHLALHTADPTQAWQLSGQLGRELNFAATYAPAELRGVVDLGAQRAVTVTSSANGWQCEASIDAAHLPTTVRDLADGFGLTLPEHGVVTAQAAIDRAGTVTIADATLTDRGLAVQLSAAQWHAEHGLLALGALHAQVWPAQMDPAWANQCPAAGVIDLQASATDGQLTFAVHSAQLPCALTATGSLAGTVASRAWATAALRLDGELSAESLSLGTTQINLSRAQVALRGTWAELTGTVALHSTALHAGAWQSHDVAAHAEFDVHRLAEHTVINGIWHCTGTVSNRDTAPDAGWPLAGGGEWHADADGTRCTADFTSPLTLHATLAQPTRCTGDRAWLAALTSTPLAAEGAVSEIDLTRLAALLPAGLHLDGFLSGTAATPDLLSGSRWSAEATLRAVNCGGFPPLPPLLAINGTVRADQNGITVTGLQARAGEGQLEIHGTLPLPNAPGPLALTIASREALIFQRPDVRLRANADLALTGTWSEPALSGQIQLTDLVATTPVSWLGGHDLPPLESPLDELSALPAPWNRTRLDLHLSGGEGAHPALEIRNQLVVADFAVAVTLTGRADVPVPAGEIRCRSGRISLPFSAYRIDQAALRFQASDPYDPVIEATASAQVQGYQLTVQVSGTLRHPHVEVSAMPPLSPEAALVLATTGRLPAEVQQDGATKSALGIAAPFIGRELQRWFLGDDFADDGESVLDRFTVLYDEERSERGLSTARVEYQALGPWYLFGERDVFEAYNVGLMWRWIFNDPARQRSIAVPDPEETSAPRAAWAIEPAPGVAKLPVSAATLLDTVPARQRHGPSANQPAALASAAQRMVDRLREAGYPEALVQPELRPSGDLTTVHFVVTPGQPWQLQTVTVHGAPADLSHKLELLVATGLPVGGAPTPSRVGATRAAVRSALINAGYALATVRIDVRRTATDAQTANAAIAIQPGLRYTVLAPTPLLSGNVPPGLAQALAETCREVDGRAWTRRQGIELRARVLHLLHEAGYTFATVEISGDEPGLVPKIGAQIRITPGLPVTLHAINLQGFTHTSPDYVLGRLALSPGAALGNGEPEAAIARLRRSGVARRLTTTLTPAKPPLAANHADLSITSEDAPPRSIEFALGYGSYEGARSSAVYRDTNLFGWGRTWEMGGDVSQRSYGGHTRIIDRDLLGIQRVLSVTLSGGWREEPSFDRTSYASETEIRAPLASWLDLRTAYTFAAERATNRAASTDGSEQEGFVLNGALSANIIWDGRDDRQLPTRGGVAELGLGVSDPVLGSQVSYVEWSSRLGWVVPIVDDRLTGAVHIAGTVRQITDDAATLPIQYRMFLGGSTTVRSFGLNQLSPVSATGDALGGLTTAYANAELRTKIAGNLYGAGFYDIGKVSERSWNLHGALGQALGAGLRYHLPFGPIRVDGAYNPGERWAATHAYAIEAAVGFTF